MKRVVLFLMAMLSMTMAFAQITHEVFGMSLGSDKQKVLEAWTKAGVKYERSNEFKEQYHIRSKNENRKPEPTAIDVVFLNNKMFCARYTYPKDHFVTVSELINMMYGKCQTVDQDEFKVFYDDKTKHFVNVGIWEEHTVLTYGVVPAPDSPQLGERRGWQRQRSGNR